MHYGCQVIDAQKLSGSDSLGLRLSLKQERTRLNSLRRNRQHPLVDGAIDQALRRTGLRVKKAAQQALDDHFYIIFLTNDLIISKERTKEMEKIRKSVLDLDEVMVSIPYGLFYSLMISTDTKGRKLILVDNSTHKRDRTKRMQA